MLQLLNLAGGRGATAFPRVSTGTQLQAPEELGAHAKFPTEAWSGLLVVRH